MLIKIPKASDCHESDVTPESIYLSRRSVLGAAIAGLAVGSLPRWAMADDATRYPDVDPGKAPSWFREKLPSTKWGAVNVRDEAITPFKDATHYNNFYEFGTDKVIRLPMPGS
jgi:sulfoxide reductase catalytic subunit YedY